ncbi:MAG: DNA-binding protein [Egibacteraceae bacterium]
MRFLGDLASGVLSIAPIHAADTKYRDFPLGTVDASVIAATERLGIGTIATLDRRHFGVVRPRHRDTFELLP